MSIRSNSISSSTRSSPEGSKLPQKHVLFLSPRWRCDQHSTTAGVVTVTHELVDNLRAIDPHARHVKIYCLVALLDQYIAQDEKLDALKKKVILIGARPPRGDDSTPSSKWIDLYPSTYYTKSLEHFPKMTHIIGHLPFLPNGPTNIRDVMYKGDTSIQTILINHKLPCLEDGTPDEEHLDFCCQSADVLVSIGHSLYNFTERVLLDNDSDLHHILYLANCPASLLRHSWLHSNAVSGNNGLNGIQNILVCAPDRQTSGDLDLNTVCQAVAEAARRLVEATKPRDKVKVTLTLIAFEKDIEQWSRDIHNIMDSLNGHRVGFSIHDKKKMISLMKRASLLIHPQNQYCSNSELDKDLLCAVSMGLPVLVEDGSSLACYLESLDPDSRAIVRNHGGVETIVEAWAGMIVQKLMDPELTAEQASELKINLLKDTSVRTSQTGFARNIIDGFSLEVNFVNGCKINSSGRKLRKVLEVHKIEDISRDQDLTCLALILSTLSLQREKLTLEGIREVLIPDALEEVCDLFERFLKALEGEKRYLLDIKSDERNQKIIFEIFCPQIDDVTNLCTTLSDNDEDLPKLMLMTMENIVDFDSVVITMKEHGNVEGFEELTDFKVNMRKNSSGSSNRKPNRAPYSKLPVPKPSQRKPRRAERRTDNYDDEEEDY